VKLSGIFKAIIPQTNDATNRGYQALWKFTAQREIYGRVHGDLFNVPRLLLPGVQLRIKFTKSKSTFYVMSTVAFTEATFILVDATLHVRHVKPSPTILPAHAKALEKVNAQYDMTRVALKTFTFEAGSKSVSINNAVLETLPNVCFSRCFQTSISRVQRTFTPTSSGISGSTIS
jgi:hypothetical protein